ncbi:hypothetical protein DFJ58DRAFT_715740 [Suillus subalutaceus]|uniref:uncharacterized protein n=1 Tax=Suillus subalutaceus TaxID=48586 RepID=UPI001B88046A|nr:uncharacterized protein DFJ58DRAFT_715740 [Suillus subalutaceus]KAG1858958.1 hypothetical protein DFJ58DRAFT_715740 [Suillus subalutaceus]
MIAPPKRANLPDKDFYSFRYNFKPESGTVEVKRRKDLTSNHLFNGTEQPVREYDCTFTLEKVECFMGFTYDKKVSSSSSSFTRKSPFATTPPAAQPKNAVDLEKELERDLLGLSDANGEVVDDIDDILAKVTGQRQEEEEEEEGEEGEEIEIPPREAPSLPPPPSKPKAPRPAAPPPKSTSPNRSQNPNPRKEDSDLEEVLDFDRPGRPSKRPKPPVSTGLALPGTTSSFVPPAPPTKPAAAESDSEEDWDEVTHNDLVEEEIDLDAFGREMDAELEEESDDDILMAVMSPDLESVASVSGRPMSVSQFAGGQLSADEDDTSSSEDSDED